MKKIITVMLMLALMLALTAPAVADIQAPNLETASIWAVDAINEAVDKGFVHPFLQNRYRDNITRSQFCQIAVAYIEYATGRAIDLHLLERGLSRDLNAFTDTNIDYVLAAYALGIVQGEGNNSFSPSRFITRQEAAVMLTRVCRFIGAEEPDKAGLEPLADDGLIASWARDGVDYVRAQGIMSGVGGSRFDPQGWYTREQSIITFNRVDLVAPPPNATGLLDVAFRPWHLRGENIPRIDGSVFGLRAAFSSSDYGTIGTHMRPSTFNARPGDEYFDVYSNTIRYFGTEGFEAVFNRDTTSSAPGGYFGIRSDGKWLLNEVLVLFESEVVYTREAKIQASNDGTTWVDLWIGELTTTRLPIGSRAEVADRHVIGIQLLYPQNAGAFHQFRFVTDERVTGVNFYGVEDFYSILNFSDINPNYPARDGTYARDQEITFLELMNEIRAQRGLAPNVWLDLLATAAKSHTECMRNNRYFSHSCIYGHGGGPGDRAVAAGWPWHEANASEILYQGGSSAYAATDAYRRSPRGHGAIWNSPPWYYIGPGTQGGTWTVKYGSPETIPTRTQLRDEFIARQP